MPVTLSRPFRLPRRPILIASPSRVALVGSPTSAWSGCSPLAAIQSSTLRVPLIAGPSSSPVMSRLIEPAMSSPLARDEIERRGGEAGDGALHVGGAPSVEHAVRDLGGEGRIGPQALIARRHHVGMAGEAEMRRPEPMRAIEIVDRRRAVLGESEPLAVEAAFARARSSTSRAPASSGVTLGQRIKSLASSTGLSLGSVMVGHPASRRSV